MPDAPRRVLMVCTAAKGGIRAVVEGYRASGILDEWGVEVLYSHREGSVASRGWAALAAYATFCRRLLGGGVRLVHLHAAMYGSFWRKALFATTARAWGVPVVFHMHGSETAKFYASQPALLKRLIAQVLRRASVVMVLSESWQAFVHQVSPDAHVEVVPNYVRMPPPPSPRSEPGPTDGALVQFLFLGAIGKRKGIYELLRAFALVHAQCPQVRLVVGGEGELDQARQLARELDLAPVIRFAGWVSGDTKDALLAESDVYVLPSFHEGLPVSILEAMSHGLPVISTTVGGIPELVRDGVDGLLAAPGQVDVLAAQMLQLASAADLRRTLGQSARLRVSSGFSDAAVLPRLRALYTRLALP